MLPNGIFKQGIDIKDPPIFDLPVHHLGIFEQNGPLKTHRRHRVFPVKEYIGVTKDISKVNLDQTDPCFYSELYQYSVYSTMIIDSVLWPSRNIHRWGTCSGHWMGD